MLLLSSGGKVVVGILIIFTLLLSPVQADPPISESKINRTPTILDPPTEYPTGPNAALYEELLEGKHRNPQTGSDPDS